MNLRKNLKLLLEMKNNNKLNSKINFQLYRAMYIMALFIFLFNLIYPQISKIENQCLWITTDNMFNQASIDSSILFAYESGFNVVFLQIRRRGDAFYNSDIVKKILILQIILIL